jgi:hypothetical protein
LLQLAQEQSINNTTHLASTGSVNEIVKNLFQRLNVHKPIASVNFKGKFQVTHRLYKYRTTNLVVTIKFTSYNCVLNISSKLAIFNAINYILVNVQSYKKPISQVFSDTYIFYHHILLRYRG